MAAQARETQDRPYPSNIRLVESADSLVSTHREVAVTDGAGAKVVPLGHGRTENQAQATVPEAPVQQAERLESPTEPAVSSKQRLAEQLDRALDDIRRLISADRNKGPY